jgi:nicotinamide-nucleotide amidase
MADHEALKELATAVVNDLSEASKAVATAESCSGGWVAKAITDVPGSSACFGYGVVSYSNGAKESILGVGNATLEEHGSVSEPVVREMADGVLHLSGADIAVAVSGIAGPEGGTDDKPVGTVWFAWAVRDHSKIRMETACQQFDGDREAIRELTVAYALQGVLERIRP